MALEDAKKQVDLAFTREARRGLAFENAFGGATSFLRRDGRQSPEMGWEDVLAHMDHLLSILGEDHIGLGSDFDGATVPKGIGDVVGQQALLEAFRAHGYGEALVRKIAHENWFRVLERTWGA